MKSPGNILKTIRVNYFKPAFLICVGVLAASAGAMPSVIKQLGIRLKKDPLPLKKSLSQLDTSGLLPYKVVSKEEIENPDVLETLGTEDYLQWILEDTIAPADSKTRFCTLFITYYGQADQVPHIPEECYIGSGLRQITSETVTLTIKPTQSETTDERQISAHYLVFAKTSSETWGSETTFPIFYTFSVNGEYAGGRLEVRNIMNKNLIGKFSYFSKVEWKFYNNSFGRIVSPDKQEAIEASEKLLTVILPVLEKDHWPSGLW
jgi:hypothetical protein